MSGAEPDTATAEPQRPVRWRLRSLAATPAGRLIGWQLLALAGQVAAVCLARLGRGVGFEHPLSNVSFAVAYGSALWLLTRPNLTRTERNLAVAALAVTPALMWRATNPLLFTGFDEQLHMRTLRDLIHGRALFDPNPILEVSARYPGLEAITALVHQLGLPVLAAATTVIFIARLALVSVLCDAVEQLTGSARAGGLAVAIYALSPQFIFFNSQFSYQTVALPLALGAVSLIARARHNDDQLPLYIGATVCLVAMSMTHHLTSFITAGFLLVWALVERGRARIAILYGALAAVASTLAWAGVQSKMLRNYLKPIFDDYNAKFTGGVRRKVFSEAGGATSPLPDRLVLVYYAGLLCLGVAGLLLLAWRNRREQPLRGPNLLLLAMAAALPVLCAAFLLPKGGEIFYRSSSLLFFPLSLLVARVAVRLFWRGPENTEGHHRKSLRSRMIVVAALSVMFVGGFVLGSGPFWSRLPGPYIAVADTRSMDAETLAAVEWARRSLPPGSRIAGDRVSSTLLASRAGLWPVMKGPPRVDAAALYVAPRWEQIQTDMAVSMRLRYLYVDRRLALERPRFGFYFQQGETGDGKQLTDSQLTKFDGVKGIDLVYRHGPVSIYDLKNLGIPDDPTGRFTAVPHMAVPLQLALGVVHGLLIVALMSSRLGAGIAARVRQLYRAAGPALTLATGLAAACLLAVCMLLVQLWPTQLVVLSAAAVVVAAFPQRTVAALGRLAGRVQPHHARAVLAVGIAGSVILAVAVASAAHEVDFRVRDILRNTGLSVSGPPG